MGNFDDTAPITIDPVPNVTNGVQWVGFDLPARHDFSSVRFEIEEVSLGSPTLGQSYSVVELAIALQEEGGIARLPIARSA